MQQPSPFTLDGFLKTLCEAQGIAKRAEVQVEFERAGGATTYTLSSLDKRSLELSVQKRMDEAEQAEHGGFAQFLTPWKVGERWMTRGEVVMFPAPSSEAAE